MRLVVERIHFYNNWMDTTKEAEVRKGFLLNQIDLTASWNLDRHLGYVGIANYIDVADPELTIAPFAGVQWNSKKKVFLQAETRYLAANRQPEIVDVPFATLGYGAFSVTGSIGWSLGKGKQDEKEREFEESDPSESTNGEDINTEDPEELIEWIEETGE